MATRGRRRDCAGIVALVFLVYAGSLDNGFHFDDDHSILQNEHLRSMAAVPDFFTDATTFSGDPQYGVMYRPLVVLSLALNHAISGLNPWSYHLVNVLLHALGSVVLLVLLRRFLPRLSRQAVWAAALVAVHPIHSQIVNYVSSRSGLLAALGVLLALWSASAVRWPVRVGGTALAHLLGLLSKSTAIVLAPLLALRALGRGQAQRGWGGPLVASIVASGAYLFAATATGFLGQSLDDLVRPFHVQVMTQAKACAYYLWLTVMPVHLSVIHPFAVASIPSAGVVAAALLIGSAGGIALRRWLGRGDEGAYGVLWVLGSLGVTFLMPLNVIVSEQRLYLSSFGAALSGVALLAPRPVACARVWGAAGLGILALLAIQRTSVWQSELTLWHSAGTWAPDSPRVYANLGAAYYRAGDHTSARANYQRTVELDPEQATAWLNLGVLAERAGDDATAEVYYRRTLELRPDWAQAQRRLGAVLVQRGALQQARDLLERALEVQPHAGALVNLGVARRRLGDLPGARVCFEAALDLAPEAADAIVNLGVLAQEQALAAQGERRQQGLQQARQYYERALISAPDQSQALLNLGGLLRAMGKDDEALALFERAVAAHPRLAPAHAGLGEALATAGRLPAAIAALSTAVGLDSSDAAAWKSLGRARAQAGQLEAAAAALGRVCLLEGESPENLYNHAEVLTALGQEAWAAGRRAEGLRHWRDARGLYGRIDPGFRRTAQRLRQLASRLR